MACSLSTFQLGYIPFKSINFPGGEVHIAIDLPIVEPDTGAGSRIWYRISKKDLVTITAHLTTPRDIMELLMLTDAVKRLGGKRIHLYMPYIPYARQDRVANGGEALAIKVFADLINAQEYGLVTVCDPHSDVSTALINNCEVFEQADVFRTLKLKKNIDLSNTVIVAPDGGALKKANKVAKELGVTRVIHAGKVRDTKTGEITGTKVYWEGYNSEKEWSRFFDFLIVDDICDGGRTFIELAKELKETQNADRRCFLAISHGIFSKGLEVFKPHIDHIFVAYPWIGVKDNDFVTLL